VNIINTKTGHGQLVLVAFLWSVLVLLSLYSNINNFNEHSIRLATNQANDYWNKDNAFRAWATRHGGLYVKPDARTPPNRLLAHLPHRDLTTADGTRLTLMNPAYMMRQMVGEFDDLYGVKGSITGQVLLDPEGKRNKPDDWELTALKQFDQGIDEVTEISTINGDAYLRFMRPMMMTEGCEVCHGHLGFKLGDIRGGVSVSVPLAPFELANEKSRNQAVFSHLTIWLLGTFAVFYIGSIKRTQTERERESKEMVDRAQRMDALGKLSGGIAHDYNNMLGVIMGYAELLEYDLRKSPELAEYARQITHASKRGSVLTRKLLAFSGKQSSEAEAVHLNTLLRNQQQLLEKTLTARIQLKLDLAADLWQVSLNSGDMEDAIVNLSINAMHAIKTTGTLTIHTSNEKLNSTDASQMDLPAGDYVLLSITDDGDGMDKETREKIFEPFYSTKGSQGTGLGLSQVHGFVQNCKGAIKVYSEPGHGSRFAIYLPRMIESARDQLKENDSSTETFKGNETILVVDDEPALLKMASEILNQQGYKVLCAEGASQALDILASESIDLLLSDVIMPEIDGYQLAKKVREKYPDIKIQLVSGFTDNRQGSDINDDLHQSLIAKPFNSKTLLQRIRSILDETLAG